MAGHHATVPPVDFDLTDEQRQVRSTVREFARDEIAPRAAAYDQSGEFPYDLVAGMARLGLFALPFAESVGGAGGDFLSYCLALEEIARADAAVAITLEAAVSLGISPIVSFGTADQKERWLPQLLSGDRLWSFGLTEPGAGSDAAGTLTRAARDRGEWVINGAKCFITNAGTDISAAAYVRTGNPPCAARLQGLLLHHQLPAVARRRRDGCGEQRRLEPGCRHRHCGGWVLRHLARPQVTQRRPDSPGRNRQGGLGTDADMTAQSGL